MSRTTSLALASATFIPAAARRLLRKAFRSTDDLFGTAAPLVELSPALSALRETLKRQGDLKAAENVERKIRAIGGWMVFLGDADYPTLLSEISDPPLVLFGKGNLPATPDRMLGVVGPRRPSTYGARVAKWLARDLAEEGLVLVSGLARGIDALAHEAALQAGRPTVAVMACGLDLVYPPEHQLLKSKIEKGGAVVTEFFPGEPSRKEQFPQRNRIISGLSRGVLLVEAGERSGARITARHAVEQNREVYVVPGPIDSPLSFWPNRLLGEGAKVVTTSADILEDFIPDFQREDTRVSLSESIDESSLSDPERLILSALAFDQPRGAEELSNQGGSSVSDVLRTLMDLELKGLVVKQPDARYVRLQ